MKNKIGGQELPQTGGCRLSQGLDETPRAPTSERVVTPRDAAPILILEVVPHVMLLWLCDENMREAAKGDKSVALARLNMATGKYSIGRVKTSQGESP